MLGSRVGQWVRSLDLTANKSLSPIRRGVGSRPDLLIQGILRNGIFCLVRKFFVDKRGILGKLLYVLIALILMLLSVFFLSITYLKDIYSMSHFYFCLPWLLESCIPVIFFLLKYYCAVICNVWCLQLSVWLLGVWGTTNKHVFSTCISKAQVGPHGHPWNQLIWWSYLTSSVNICS